MAVKDKNNLKTIIGRSNHKIKESVKQNIKVRTVGTGERQQLILTVDLGVNLGISKSGKSVVIATSGGCKNVPNAKDILYNLNVFLPIEEPIKTRSNKT